MHPPASSHLTETGDRLAYRKRDGASPGVIFLGGFRSEMIGEKAAYLDAFCERRGLSYLRFDYHAHGESPGDFREGGIKRWAANAINIITHRAQGPQILIGSSMGGWLMLIAALAMPERITGLIGIAAAPDFTEDLMYDRMSGEQQETLHRQGFIMTPSDYGPPYPITRRLIDEGREYLVLRRGALPLTCPVRLLQGMEDTVVPWTHAVRLAESFESRDVQLTLLPHADHRLSSPENLELLGETLEKLVFSIRKTS